MSTAMTRLRAFDSVVTIRRPKRGPASASIAKNPASPSATMPHRPVLPATTAISCDHLVARWMRVLRAHAANPMTSSATPGDA